MRRRELAGLIAVLLVATVALSTNPLDTPEAAPELTPAEAAVYATQLQHLAGDISDRYVRPIERRELVLAGLMALYEAARVPVPDSLEKDLPGDEDKEFLPFIIKTRAELGNPKELNGNKALLLSLRGMANRLDSFSDVLIGGELNRKLSHESQDGYGLEVEGVPGPGPVRIKEVLPGSPAQKAGLRPGDLVTHLDGKPISDGSVASVILHAESSTEAGASAPRDRPLDVAYQRPEQAKPRHASLVREHFTTETIIGYTRDEENNWNYWLDRRAKIALVRVGNLDHSYRENQVYGTSDELAEVLTGLKAGGMRGLILDLRWSPGGFLDEAVLIALNFVGQKRVATVKTRNGPEVEYASHAQVPTSPRPEHKFLDFPIVVLTNSATSGGAELIAGAIQDHARGKVLGQRTRGKASIQTILPLPIPGGGMKLTSGTFLRPNNKNLNRFPDSKPMDDWGIRPDREIRLSPSLQDRLEQWWTWQSLRPGATREALPLDDLTNDPQLLSAFEALRRDARQGDFLLNANSKPGEVRRRPAP